MSELEAKFGHNQVNILLSGHRCTTGCVGAYFLGVPQNGNLLQFASANGKYKIYTFGSNEPIEN